MSSQEVRRQQEQRNGSDGVNPHPEWEERFFESYKKTHLIGEAIKAAGISRQYFNKFRNKCPEFAEKFFNEEENSTEILEQIAVRRAAEGSDTLLIFLLKARRPQTYRDNVFHDHQHQHTGSLQLMIGDTQPIEIEASKRREAAKLLMAGDDVVDSTAEEIEEGEAA